MGIELFVFSVEASQFSKFHKNESKQDSLDFNPGLTVTFRFKKS